MTDDERLRLQAHLRKMYLEVEKVCDRYGLRMMVAYGTVIGVLRHQGFIPWDDDMDLFMPREDYDKLIHLYADELPVGYKIYAPNSKNGPIYRFAKIVDTNTRLLIPGSTDCQEQGIFLDIFPLENVSNGLALIKIKRIIACFLLLIPDCVKQFKEKSEEYKNLMCASAKGKKTYMLRNTVGFIFSFVRWQTWYNWFDSFVQNKDNNGSFCVPSGSADLKYFLPIDENIYLPVKRMKFDDIEVYVPNQPEKHCEMEYGDWKTMPPVDQRWQHFIKEIRF